MSSNDPNINNPIEQDFGSSELNDVYANLDEPTKEKIDKIKNEKVKINLLKDISNPELNNLFNSLSHAKQKQYEDFGIRDKYLLLKELLETKKKTEALKPKKEIIKPPTPEEKIFIRPPSPLDTPPSDTPPEDTPPKDTPPKEKIFIRPPSPLDTPPSDNTTLYTPPSNIPPLGYLEVDTPPSYTRANDNPPQELFEKEEEEDKKEKSPPQVLFDNLVKQYYASNPHIYNSTTSSELEVRFGTKGIKRLTKTDYDDVIKKLKSLGFNSINENGNYSLKIQNEYLDKNTGVFKLSNVRTEINGLHNIQEYCKNNDINALIKKNADVAFVQKNNVFIDKKDRIRPVNFDDFNFRVSYQKEEKLSSNKGVAYYILNNWRTSKKTFRFLNRVTFIHESYPILVDISIVKKTDMVDGDIQKYYTTDEAELFDRPESYEIELEVNNKIIGPGTNFNNYNIILESLRSVIKIVLGGLQGTNFPISYPEQRQVLESYMKMLHMEDYNPKKPVYSSDFIGPSSVTLQLENISPLNENSVLPNIRKDFVVTEKADGVRHLLYVNDTGKIYLINSNMKVIFTGAKTNNEETFNSLIDGELINHDKDGKFINLYAAFDIYYKNKIDFRTHPFMPNLEKASSKKGEKDARYLILKSLIDHIDIVSILQPNEKQTGLKSIVERVKKSIVNSPIRLMCKNFYPENFESKTSNIFDGCNTILSKDRNGLFEYNTDGLIFTHAFYGVGGDAINVSGPLSKITWIYSFKWKPPQFNTIDFLVTTIKNPDGSDVVQNKFDDGLSASASVQINNYKTIQLRCSFNENRHGYINPCQDVIDDNLPEYKGDDDKSDRESKPVQFYPTNPYDPNAGICNIMLKLDDNNSEKMVSEEGEVFEDNTIVEFSYNKTKIDGWQWIPLRVRHDKTSEMRQGMQQFGNAYHVANDNWKSIHNEITAEMMSSGLNIPDLSFDDDIYYNKTTGSFKTEGLKNFHNLYVKKLLIKSVSKQGDTLIDFACGKAGDLPKWIASRLSFVFGIDISIDNLENRIDGACARFLKAKKQHKNMPYALFVNGSSAYNIKNGSAMLNDKAIQITNAVFGNGTKDSDKIGKGVSRQYGKGSDGFNVSSCQFALHYFWETPAMLQGFMRNLSECTKLNGYFIGTAYDGKEIFKLLRNTATGESVKFINDNKQICEIVKGYNIESLEDDSSSIGHRIDVCQESINKLIPEYLVNFDYFNRVMENYGFKLIDRDEAQNLGLPQGSGLFSELFLAMMEEVKRNKYKENDLGNATKMTEFEKKISFLNRYFVYKKIRHINEAKATIELEEYNEEERIMSETITKPKAKKNIEESNEKKESKEKPVKKIRKLNSKLILIPATEAIDETENIQSQKTQAIDNLSNIVLDIDVKKVENKKIASSKKNKKSVKLIIEGDDE
jgi:hypothetical protein